MSQRHRQGHFYQLAWEHGVDPLQLKIPKPNQLPSMWLVEIGARHAAQAYVPAGYLRVALDYATRTLCPCNSMDDWRGTFVIPEQDFQGVCKLLSRCKWPKLKHAGKKRRGRRRRNRYRHAG